MKKEIVALISWNQTVNAVRELTIDNARFNVDDCCLADAIILESAANLIKRELKEAVKSGIKK